MRPSLSRESRWLLGICAAALTLRLIVGYRYPSILWPDEVFQSLEQAHRLAFGFGIVPWEFRSGARSWLLPGFLAPWMGAGSLFGGPGHVLTARAALVAISLAPLCACFLLARRHGPAAAIAGTAVCAGWWELVYFAPKALSEVVAGHLLAAALGLGLLDDEPSRRRTRVAGALLALAVALRMHLAPAALVAAVFIGRPVKQRLSPLLTGALPVLAVTALLELATWGSPFASYWNNFRFNVVDGHSADFGVLPPLAYLEMLVERWSWAGLPLLACAILGAARRPALAASALTVLATHSALAHKEYRFIYPAILLVVLLAAVGTADLVSRATARSKRSAIPFAVAAALGWLAVSAWGGARFRSVEPFERNPGQSMWTLDGAGLEATAQLGADSNVCGVAIVNTNWAWTGGYTYLHRDIPVFLARTPEEFSRVAPGVNALIVDEELAQGLNVFVVEWCRLGVCVARRPGPCLPVPVPRINEQLAAGGA